MASNIFLPEPLPDEPLSLFHDWFREAKDAGVQPNPDSMVLATVDGTGRPSARVVLCKQLVRDPGYVVFYTNYRSRKGQELAECPRAALVFHWDALSRQVRLEGPVVRSPEAESDSYFRSRPLDSRVGAWASQQSEPLASRATLAQQVAAAQVRFGIGPGQTEGEVPRPQHWGGYRLWPDLLELWVEGPFRVHDRARWTRELAQKDAYSFATGPWSATRLNP